MGGASIISLAHQNIRHYSAPIETDLSPLGDRVRRARNDRGWTIRQLAEDCGVSSRFLSDLERGRGNISIARLLGVARALKVPVSELVAPLDVVGTVGPRVALVGLRGAGKSTIGPQVAEALAVSFIELDAEIEKLAGLPLSQVFEIHGERYYRRLERECLKQILSGTEGVVLAVGGGLVTDKLSWKRLREQTTTVWLTASPEDHYHRVMEQGDLRPMANRPGAMAELQALLAARSPLYAESDAHVPTSELGLEGAVTRTLELLKERPAKVAGRES